VLITSALKTIAASREAKKSTSLRETTRRALELVRADHVGDSPREVFEPLRLACECETRTEKLMIASLDCITKLISHLFFVDDSSPRLDSLPSLLRPQDLVIVTLIQAYPSLPSSYIPSHLVIRRLPRMLSRCKLSEHSSHLCSRRLFWFIRSHFSRPCEPCTMSFS
jgi:brefeldin A-inhibited guanine nucleotide-exchange protein